MKQTAPPRSGWVPVDVSPTDLRIGDHILTGGHLVAVTDLRYRYGATRTMILSTGRLAVAERGVRVYRRPAGRAAGPGLGDRHGRRRAAPGAAKDCFQG
ncbi:hypothetical protein [Streptomyces sp. NPDC005180]|uniref:hypothetical protein n=1 Tax=Streptomyces sp. NPDC005180 TaxID=3156868 RepID=UPI0033BB415B